MMAYPSDELCQFNYFCFFTFYCWLFLVSLLYLPLLCFYLFLHLWNCHSFPYSSHNSNQQPSLIIRTSSSERYCQIQWSDSMVGSGDPSQLFRSEYSMIRFGDRKRWSLLASHIRSSDPIIRSGDRKRYQIWWSEKMIPPSPSYFQRLLLLSK